MKVVHITNWFCREGAVLWRDGWRKFAAFFNISLFFYSFGDQVSLSVWGGSKTCTSWQNILVTNDTMMLWDSLPQGAKEVDFGRDFSQHFVIFPVFLWLNLIPNEQGFPKMCRLSYKKWTWKGDVVKIGVSRSSKVTVVKIWGAFWSTFHAFSFAFLRQDPHWDYFSHLWS